jgi:hypothetical protein
MSVCGAPSDIELAPAQAEHTVPTPILYVTDLSFDSVDPADLFDLAFLLRSPEHALADVILTGGDIRDGGERVLEALANKAGSRDIDHVGRGAAALAAALRRADEPVNLVVVGGYSAVRGVLADDPAGFRERVARMFVVGGHVNDYGPTSTPRLPIDPRLRQRCPERFSACGDPRVAVDPAQRSAWAALVTSGEGVVWLPRDICLWRYAAPGVLEDGGRACEFLLRELFAASLRIAGPGADRYIAAGEPAILSALPAFLLSRRPDPFVWMRLFRAAEARVSLDPDSGHVTEFATAVDRPNLHAVVAIDGHLLGKRLTAALRDRPLEG